MHARSANTKLLYDVLLTKILYHHHPTNFVPSQLKKKNSSSTKLRVNECEVNAPGEIPWAWCAQFLLTTVNHKIFFSTERQT